MKKKETIKEDVHFCEKCKINKREASPKGIYCTSCRLALAVITKMKMNEGYKKVGYPELII